MFLQHRGEIAKYKKLLLHGILEYLIHVISNLYVLHRARLENTMWIFNALIVQVIFIYRHAEPSNLPRKRLKHSPRDTITYIIRPMGTQIINPARLKNDFWNWNLVFSREHLRRRTCRQDWGIQFTEPCFKTNFSILAACHATTCMAHVCITTIEDNVKDQKIE